MVVRVVFVVAAALVMQAGDQVRFIDLKGLDLGEAKGQANQPAVIASADELAKAITNGQAAARIKGQVDFTKEKLLYFQWAGSGGDKLSSRTAKMEKALEVIVTIQQGKTFDLQQHHQAFVIPKDATWKVERAKQGK